MGPFLQYANEKKADTIELRVYLGANGSFTIYEDEGDNYNYETGKYATIPITYTDNPRNVIIGQRSGNFSGMGERKIFNIVYVSENSGTGVGISAKYDHRLVYTGENTSVVSVYGLSERIPGAVTLPASVTIMTAGNLITLPNAFFAKKIDLAVYDCSDRILRKVVVRKTAVDAQRDLELPSGVYIVKAGVIR